MNIGFVFKYENSIGGGHFGRCLNFSSQLSKNIEFFFLTNILPKKNIDLLKNNRINYVEIKSKKFEENVLLKIKNLKIDSLILDCYDLKKTFKIKVKTKLKKLLIIDDRTNFNHHADILINNNFLTNKKKKNYKKI